MIDLSNNNRSGHDFRKAYAAGQRRLYLKTTEGLSFVDRVTPGWIAPAIHAGFKVGGYHFADTSRNPVTQAQFFHSHLAPSFRLKPCLDVEAGRPNKEWVKSFLTEMERLGHYCILYGNSSYLAECKFLRVPAPLWLAAYGRDDGKEYPVTSIPLPWKHIAAHQYSQHCRMVGINGLCDLSHVFHPDEIDAERRL